MSKLYDPRPIRSEASGSIRPVGSELSLTEKEEKLICMIREMQFGEIQLYIADGQPVRLEEVRKSVKL